MMVHLLACCVVVALPTSTSGVRHTGEEYHMANETGVGTGYQIQGVGQKQACMDTRLGTTADGPLHTLGGAGCVLSARCWD